MVGAGGAFRRDRCSRPSWPERCSLELVPAASSLWPSAEGAHRAPFALDHSASRPVGSAGRRRARAGAHEPGDRCEPLVGSALGARQWSCQFIRGPVRSGAGAHAGREPSRDGPRRCSDEMEVRQGPCELAGERWKLKIVSLIMRPTGSERAAGGRDSLSLAFGSGALSVALGLGLGSQPAKIIRPQVARMAGGTYGLARTRLRANLPQRNRAIGVFAARQGQSVPADTRRPLGRRNLGL